MLFGVITSVFPLGCMLGAILSTRLGRVYSKRRLLMCVDIMTVVFVLVSLYPAVASVVASRLAIGVLFGINVSIIPVYIREVSPLIISGAMGCMF